MSGWMLSNCEGVLKQWPSILKGAYLAAALFRTAYPEPHDDRLIAVIALQEVSIQCSCWRLDTLWDLLCMYSSLPGKGGGCPSGSFTQPLWRSSMLSFGAVIHSLHMLCT